MAKTRAILATQEFYEGFQRQLAWFSRLGNDLYFDIPCCFLASHTSYHKDGTIWRTSRATGSHPTQQGQHLPLKDFQGWYQLGIGMFTKSGITENPKVSGKHRRSNIGLVEVPLNSFPSDIMNFVVELIEPSYREVLDLESLAPPSNATGWIIDMGNPWIVVTILGHESNLLVRPQNDGFIVKHYNSRFSANLPGVEYTFEAYGDPIRN